jgi:hypothetical protein
MGDGSRNGAACSAGKTTACPVCERSLPSTRAVYCSAVCRQRAFRLRRIALAVVDDARLRAELRRRRALVAHTLYECGGCGERLLGERRCPECNIFCRVVGLGGRCTECDQPLLLAELLGLEVAP